MRRANHTSTDPFANNFALRKAQVTGVVYGIVLGVALLGGVLNLSGAGFFVIVLFFVFCAPLPLVLSLDGLRTGLNNWHRREAPGATAPTAAQRFRQYWLDRSLKTAGIAVLIGAVAVSLTGMSQLAMLFAAVILSALAYAAALWSAITPPLRASRAQPVRSRIPSVNSRRRRRAAHTAPPQKPRLSPYRQRQRRKEDTTQGMGLGVLVAIALVKLCQAVGVVNSEIRYAMALILSIPIVCGVTFYYLRWKVGIHAQNDG